MQGERNHVGLSALSRLDGVHGAMHRDLKHSLRQDHGSDLLAVFEQADLESPKAWAFGEVEIVQNDGLCHLSSPIDCAANEQPCDILSITKTVQTARKIGAEINRLACQSLAGAEFPGSSAASIRSEFVPNIGQQSYASVSHPSARGLS